MATTYNNLYLDIRRRLRGADVGDPSLEARELVCFATGKTREELLRDAMQYSRAQGFAELYEAISTAEGFAARWRVIEETACQLMQCGSVFFSQMPSAGFPQAALQDICGGPQERADTRRMIGEIMTCLTAAAVEEGLAPRMPEPEYLSMVGAGCISGILLRCALSEAPQETFAAAMEDTRKIYLAALQ